MRESQRKLLAFSIALRNDLLTPEQAEKALRSAPAGPVPLPDLLRDGWARLDETQRESVRLEFETLASDAGRARLAILATPLNDAVKSEFWGKEEADVRDAASIEQFPPTLAGSIKPGTASFAVPVERYKVLKEHARGGMGRVLLAVDSLFGREVAMKELLPDSAPPPPGQTTPISGTIGERERFLREARITGQLEHPNIVPVYEIGQNVTGALFYTMKFVRGRTMAERIKEANRDVKLTKEQRMEARLKLLDAFVDVCNAIAYAHARGVVNRDLKPANVMLGDYGETLVLDWGLARIKGQEDRERKRMIAQTQMMSRSRVQPSDPDASRLTMDGSVIGTPAYMPPEQARGDLDEVDEQSDVYMLGAILFEILTGSAPFEGPNPAIVIQSVISLPAPRVLDLAPTAPPELAAIAMGALEKEKSRRIRDARFIVEEIEAYRGGRNMRLYRHTLGEQMRRFVRRNRSLAWSFVATAAVLVAGAGVSVYYAMKAGEESTAARQSEHLANTQKEIAAGERDSARKAEADALASRKLAEEKAEVARKAAEVAEGLRIAAIAKPLAPKFPGQSLLLAMEAAKRAPGLSSNNALYAALLTLQERQRIFAHDFAACCSRFSPDGRMAASGGTDWTLRGWDGRTLAPRWRFDGFRAEVHEIWWSPDSTKLLARAADGDFRLIDAATGAQLQDRSWQAPGGRWAVWMPDGKRFVYGNGQGRARVGSMDGSTVELGEEQDRAGSAAVSPDGTRIVTVDGANGFAVFDASAGTLLRRVVPGASPATCAAFSAGGDILALGHDDGVVVLTRADDGTEIRRFSPFPTPGSVHRLLFHADGRLFAFQPRWSGIIVDVEGRPLSAVFPIPGGARPEQLNPDWSRCVGYFPESFVPVVVSTADGKEIQRLVSHEYHVNGAVFDSSGKFLLSSSQDRRLILWNSEPGQALPFHEGPRGRPNYGVGPDGRTFITRTGAGSPLSVCGLDDFKPRCSIEGSEKCDRALFHPLGGLIYTVDTETGSLREHDSSTGKILRIAPGVPGGMRRLHISPQGRAVAQWHGGEFLVLWDTASMKMVGRAEQHSGLQMAVSDDARTVAIAMGGEGTLRLHDIAAGTAPRDLSGHTGFVMQVGFAGDGRRVVSTAIDGTARIWDVESGKNLCHVRCPGLHEIGVAMNPRRNLFVAWAGGQARLASLDDGTEIANVPDDFPVAWVQWAANGEHFYAFRGDGSFREFPIDPLAVARSVAPRTLDTIELRQFDLFSPAERTAFIEKWNDEHPQAWIRIMNAKKFVEEGKIDQALAEARKAVQYLPAHPESLGSLAEMLCRKAKSLPDTDPAREGLLVEAEDVLERMVARGRYSAESLEKEEDLAPLRGRKKFKAILDSLKPK